ncbi:MAG: UDP-N-acetylmuramate/alanine ligase [Verrucomicrobiales bacterium]|nr:UDP-N-acetylmuramate/alanine ligase [Verrucomicrobiales bacterium]
MAQDFLTTAEAAGPRRIHLIGVAGSGMSGIAALLLDLGYQVSGSDRSTTVETERLQAAGLEFFCPHTAESVEGAGVIVYSSAIKAGRNVAFDAAIVAGIPLFRRAEALASIMARKQGIVIAGMHGKTTTSAMSAHVLRQAGLNPGHYVGAEIPLLGTNAKWDAEGDYFVAEGDESDGTLVLYHPRHTILLNVEEEHLDHYKDIHEINAVYTQLLDQTSGTAFYCAADEGARAVCQGRERVMGYGWENSDDFSARDLETTGQSTAFTVCRLGQPLGRIILNIPGRHNVLNALAVAALATELGVPFERIAAALSSFRGARRRFEVKRRSAFCTVVDDYGHHPTEIAATLQTARQFAQGRVICVFQPHRYTRTQLLRKEFGQAFTLADAVFILDIYPASELPIPGISGETIVEEIRAHEGDRIKVFSTPDRATAHLAIGNFLKAGDLVLTLGAGNVHEIGTRLAADLQTLEGLHLAMGEPASVPRLYEPMGRHTTLKLGGPAQFWLEPSTNDGLARVIHHCREQGIPFKVIGRGSNLLIRDGGLKGAVIHPEGGDFDSLEVSGDTIRAGVGVKFKRLAAAARAAGLGGFEWMEGIPGSVGGGLRMNAGAMGTETFDQVVSVTVLDGHGQWVEKSRDQLDVRYRSVPELSEHVAVSALFRGTPAPLEQIDAKLALSMEKRKTSQPIAASAGCIFKNPAECPAGKLVDELGLKNAAVGAARVSEVHGNFIVNDGGASAREVLDLIAGIKAKARAERGIIMETEVQIVGEDQPY